MFVINIKILRKEGAIMWQTFENMLKGAANTLDISGPVVVLLDILIVAFLVYKVIVLVRQTNTWQMAKGILIVALVYLVAYILSMRTLLYLIDSFMLYGIIAMVVVFQPELRRVLDLMGRTGFSKVAGFRMGLSGSEQARDVWRNAIVEICDTAENLSKTHTGALIVIERSTNLDEIIKTGTVVQSTISSEILESIFYSGTPLHDGAVIIRNGRVFAAGCFLPLSVNFDIGKDLGTRHRAALGMSESSDAVIVVVSEETGVISVVKGGILVRHLERQNLYTVLESDVVPPLEETQKKHKWAIWRKDSARKESE